MVRAWYLNENMENEQLENHKEPPEFVPLEALYKISGVEYFKVDEKNFTKDQPLIRILSERSYTYEDGITCSKETLSDYEKQIKVFYTEHLHPDEEIRLVLEGSGYFDIRDREDTWIRIEVSPGDLLILPGGIYHRFSLDVNEYIKVKRYYAEETVWNAISRPADQLSCRKEYLENLRKKYTIKE